MFGPISLTAALKSQIYLILSLLLLGVSIIGSSTAVFKMITTSQIWLLSTCSMASPNWDTGFQSCITKEAKQLLNNILYLLHFEMNVLNARFYLFLFTLLRIVLSENTKKINDHMGGLHYVYWTVLSRTLLN